MSDSVIKTESGSKSFRKSFIHIVKSSEKASRQLQKKTLYDSLQFSTPQIQAGDFILKDIQKLLNTTDLIKIRQKAVENIPEE
jgi:hypothetical protein